MTHATETSSHSPSAGRSGPLRRLDTIAAVLIAAVGLAFGWYATSDLIHLQDPCPSGYCGLLQSIDGAILVTAVLALVLAAAVAAHRRKARLIGLVVCGIAGGGLLLDLMREFGAREDPRGIEPIPQLFAITMTIAAVAVALAAAAVFLFFSVTVERRPTDRSQ